jgi:hypothetical protein
VEHILLSQEAQGLLPTLLEEAMEDPLQSTETQLWVVKGEMAALFSGDFDPAKAMGVVSVGEEQKGTVTPLTLREAAAALAQGEPLQIPALEQGENGLIFCGFVDYEGGADHD